MVSKPSILHHGLPRYLVPVGHGVNPRRRIVDEHRLDKAGPQAGLWRTGQDLSGTRNCGNRSRAFSGSFYAYDQRNASKRIGQGICATPRPPNDIGIVTQLPRARSSAAGQARVGRFLLPEDRAQESGVRPLVSHSTSSR
jgi:hypothetical protein